MPIPSLVVSIEHLISAHVRHHGVHIDLAYELSGLVDFLLKIFGGLLGETQCDPLQAPFPSMGQCFCKVQDLCR